MKLTKKESSLTYRKEEFSYCSHTYLCEDSGEQFSSTALDELNLLQVHNQYRDKHNLPFPQEIKDIRQKYGLAASKMSEILGLGINSYRNYENGEVPSNANGRLIQMINDPRKFRDIVDLCETLSSNQKSRLIVKINAMINVLTENQFFNSMETYLFGSKLPDSLTGYVKPNFYKLTEMVKFFAERLAPWKTVLNKLLFYSDFLAYRSQAYSMSGVRYRAIKMGPVPNNYNSIYEFMYNQGHIDIINIPFSDTVFGYKFKPSKEKEFQADIFSATEMDVLHKVAETFSKMNTNQIIEFSHNEKAWKENEHSKKLINYKYAFDIEQI